MDWQDKEREFARNADVKRRIVAQVQRLAQASDFKGAGAQMKQLSADFKAAGFAGKGTNDELWNAFNSARGAFYERQKAFYAHRDMLAEQNADKKRSIIGQVEAIARQSDAWKQGERIKQLHAEWKQIGFAPYGQDKQLNSQYYAARDSYYAVTKQYWEQWEAERERNRKYRETLIDRAEFCANEPNSQVHSQEFRELIHQWRDAGPVKKEHREDLERRFWSAKERFYARRSVQYGQGDPSAVSKDPGWKPQNRHENVKFMEQAVRDQEVVVKRAEEHYQRVRAKGSGFGLLPNKQAVDLEKARTHERIEREKLEDLRRRYKELWLKGH